MADFTAEINAALNGRQEYELTLQEFSDLIEPLARNVKAKHIEATRDKRECEYPSYQVSKALYVVHFIDYKDQASFESAGGVNNPLITYSQRVFIAYRKGVELRPEVLAQYPDAIAEIDKSIADEYLAQERSKDAHERLRQAPAKGSVLQALNDAGIPTRPNKHGAGELSESYSFDVPNTDAIVCYFQVSFSDIWYIGFCAGDGCDDKDCANAEQLAKKYHAIVRLNMADESLWLCWQDGKTKGFQEYVKTL